MDHPPQLGDEAALADAGLALHEDDTGVALRRPRPRRGEHVELDLATDQLAVHPGAQAGRDRQLQIPRFGGGTVDHTGRRRQQEHGLGLIEILELRHAELDQTGPVGQRGGDPLGCGRRDEYVAAAGDGAQPGDPVDGAAEVVALALDGLAGVQRHPHRQHAIRRPGLGVDRVLRGERRGRRVDGRGEHAERRVALALGLDQQAAVVADGRAHQLIVTSEHIGHHLRRPLPHPRRTLDVGEQEGDLAGRRRRRHRGGPSTIHAWRSHAIFVGEPQIARDASIPDITVASTAPMSIPLRVQSPASTRLGSPDSSAPRR